eukprot:g10124.t1
MGLVLGRISYSQYLIQTNLLSAMREHLEERLGQCFIPVYLLTLFLVAYLFEAMISTLLRGVTRAVKDLTESGGAVVLHHPPALLGAESHQEEMIRTLGGCPPSMTNFSQCRTDPRRSHFTLENWEDTVTVEWDMIFREMGEFAPVNLGSAGYSGYDGVYILQDARERCQAETGLQLSYYSNFNASWFHPDRYAATVAMIAPHRVMNCTVGVNFFHPEYAKDGRPGRRCSLGKERMNESEDEREEYVRATGDTQATEEVDGRLVLKCFQERWFVAPSCRGNASNCVAVVTSGAGWGLHFMIQQAYFHNMPLAFASAEWEEYIDINLEFQPLSDRFERELTLRKYAAAGLDVVADRVYGLAENLNIGDGDMANLLWILSNTDAWQSWVPYQTVCAVGKGLVDLQNNFVSLRSEAVNCAVCPPGFASLKSQSTRVCSKCQPGFYQNSFRAAECLPCEPGTISSEAGSHHCTPCSLGSFANRSGMLACDRCGNGSQEELWTTSMQVDVYEETTWIQVQGASSAQFCFCVEGSFLWQGRCQQCTTGSYCRGSNQLEVLPGYFSSSVAPGEIYKCLSASHCPGGKPGTCTVGRDPDSLGCSSCLSMLRAKDGGSCGECDNGDYLLAVASVAAVFIGVGIIYYVLFQEQKAISSIADGLKKRRTHRRGKASSCLFQGYLLFFHRPMSLRNLKLSQLFRTIGTIFMIWFIIVFSLLLEPFQCYEHPNQVLTLKHMYQSVLCNGQGRHMHMYIIGGVACAMPMGFLVFCTWIVLVEIPKGIAQVDTSALDAYFFLIRRLRPGAEIFSVLFQVRNLFVVLCPLVPSIPAIFTRKWCMGEMATAFTNEVRTVLLAWPTMVLPDEQFIENYRSTETLWLPGLLTDAAVKHLVQSLTGHRGSTNLTPRVSGLNNPESPSNSMVVPIMVDPKNIESVAAALVLQHLLRRPTKPPKRIEQRDLDSILRFFLGERRGLETAFVARTAFSRARCNSGSFKPGKCSRAASFQ